MTIFIVKNDYADGMWVKDHPHPVVEVLASSPKEAAEFVCDMPLKNSGNKREYRAQVWRLGGVQHACEISHFYSA